MLSKVNRFVKATRLSVKSCSSDSCFRIFRMQCDVASWSWPAGIIDITHVDEI